MLEDVLASSPRPPARRPKSPHRAQQRRRSPDPRSNWRKAPPPTVSNGKPLPWGAGPGLQIQGSARPAAGLVGAAHGAVEPTSSLRTAVMLPSSPARPAPQLKPTGASGSPARRRPPPKLANGQPLPWGAGPGLQKQATVPTASPAGTGSATSSATETGKRGAPSTLAQPTQPMRAATSTRTTKPRKQAANVPAAKAPVPQQRASPAAAGKRPKAPDSEQECTPSSPVQDAATVAALRRRLLFRKPKKAASADAPAASRSPTIPGDGEMAAAPAPAAPVVAPAPAAVTLSPAAVTPSLPVVSSTIAALLAGSVPAGSPLPAPAAASTACPPGDSAAAPRPQATQPAPAPAPAATVPAPATGASRFTLGGLLNHVMEATAQAPAPVSPPPQPAVKRSSASSPRSKLLPPTPLFPDGWHGVAQIERDYEQVLQYVKAAVGPDSVHGATVAPAAGGAAADALPTAAAATFAPLVSLDKPDPALLAVAKRGLAELGVGALSSVRVSQAQVTPPASNGTVSSPEGGSGSSSTSVSVAGDGAGGNDDPKPRVGIAVPQPTPPSPLPARSRRQ